MAETLPPLRDRIKPGVRVLFVGINPGIRSSLTGHHFAGFSNRFWTLLFESGLVPERVTYKDDDRLPEFGFGITNIVPRPTPGIDTIEPIEYVAGRVRLRRKILRYRPPIVALPGVKIRCTQGSQVELHDAAEASPGTYSATHVFNSAGEGTAQIEFTGLDEQPAVVQVPLEIY